LPSNKPKILVKNLKKQFGNKVVLDGVDIEVKKGESLVVIGGSGSGKSVLIKSIIGIMVESHLKVGRQEIPENLCDLEYGKSVTDGCIDWDTTEKVLLEMHEALKDVLPNR
jgi:3-deoxy-7-phosphoheptulonate synthase